jgi:methylated-DNA-[protein]-cysteine S-methyltransferase
MNFSQKCYKLLSQIPKGKISTYKDIANALHTKAYRAVGNAMAKNPNPIIVPCHRVINSNGSIGGYALGVDKKISLLKNEGIIIRKRKVVDFEEYVYLFK